MCRQKNNAPLTTEGVKLHTPEGVRDFLPAEFAYKKEVTERIMSVFFRYGYEAVESPTLEYLDVFEGKDSIPAQDMYKLFDRNGEPLALRSDMTPQIARMATTYYQPSQLPLRFCYTADSFRNSTNYQGKLKEFTQSGIELIGSGSVAADSEVIAVAINSLIAAGCPDFKIDVGHPMFLKSILKEEGLAGSVCASVLQNIALRDYVAVEKLISIHNLSTSANKIFNDLPLLTGDVSLLDNLREFTNNPEALAALDELKQIYGFLCAYGLQDYVLFDLAMIGNLDYYTGFIFRGYTYGTGFSILDGGRYDTLFSKFGRDYPAVGFAIRINHLISALQSKSIQLPMEQVDTLLVYDDGCMQRALATGDELRSQGLFIENSLLGGDLEKNITYAKQKGISGIIYFFEDSIKLVDLNTCHEKIVSLEQLLAGGE